MARLPLRDRLVLLRVRVLPLKDNRLAPPLLRDKLALVLKVLLAPQMDKLELLHKELLVPRRDKLALLPKELLVLRRDRLVLLKVLVPPKNTMISS